MFPFPPPDPHRDRPKPKETALFGSVPPLTGRAIEVAMNERKQNAIKKAVKCCIYSAEHASARSLNGKELMPSGMLGSLRMEQIPSSLADSEELVPLGLLRLGAVAASAKGASPRRRAVAQRWAGAFLIFSTRTTLAGASAVICVSATGSRRWRGGGLVATVVNDSGQKLRTSSRKLLLGFLGRLVFPRSCRQRAWWRRRVCRGRRLSRTLVTGPRRLGSIVRMCRKALAKHITDGRKTVTRLGRRDMVDVRGA